MNAQRNQGPTPEETSLRGRAASLRAATVRQAASEPARDGTRSYADQFDFSAFSVIDAVHLYEAVKQIDLFLGHLGNMPLCTTPDAGGFPTRTPVGKFISDEEERIAFLRSRCVTEIARRSPQDDHERDQILSVRIGHALDCGSRIDAADEPGLLIDALKAWGVS